MNCPKCVNQTLHNEAGPNDVKVDRCPECQGVWLDNGEIASYTGGNKRLQVVLDVSFENAVPSPRSCPRDKAKLKQARVGDGQLLIDRCPTCQGLWCDDAELGLLLSL